MKQLQDAFTTQKQSKKLIDLGLPVDSADCYYPSEYTEQISSRIGYSLRSDFFDIDNESIPSWSIGRLLEIFDICYSGEYRDSLILSMWMDIDSITLALSDKECIDFSKLEE